MEPSWSSLSISEIFKSLETSNSGLSHKEVIRRIKRDGLNHLPESKADSIFLIFLRQFQSPLIYILLAASLAVFAIGERVDGTIIMIVLFFNALIGSIQEGRARNTLIALKKFVETKAIVLRDGKELIVPDTEIVIGDIIILQEGDKIPADARLIDARNLKVDESALTGESEAIHKTAETLNIKNPQPQEQKNVVFKGSNIVGGSGKAVVVNTGANTVIGKIAKEVASIETEIPLKANIRHLSQLIISITLSVSALLFVIGVLTGKPAGEMLAVIISIIVSVIPEGLPVAITIVLAAGVWRMSKRNALVKRLQAVEALGQAKIIAVDKTGTLTKNEMMVQTIFVSRKMFEVGGVGYEPQGDVRFRKEVVEVGTSPELQLVGKLAAFCASARAMYDEEKKLWRVTGDPTEAALFVLGEKLGFKKDEVESVSPLISEIPFDYHLKYHATQHKVDEKRFTTVLGAPEAVISLASKIWEGGEERWIEEYDIKLIEEKVLEISRKGLRVLAICINSNTDKELKASSPSDLTLVGLLGLKDALRPEVKESTRRAIEAGIKVIMITGDHRNTAEAIAEEAHIYRPGDKTLTGKEIDEMSEETLKSSLTNVSVFARVTPEHKFRIINAYKARGEIVAMTGDGVNDAPSLVAADLGVAMGKVGTEVAKEASDIVLLDDNFGSIVSAVEEGRSIYKTIKKVVLYLLSTSIGELLTITGALLLSLPLPLLPAQIIWLNFVTDGFFTVALAMEPREKGLLRIDFDKPKKYLVDTLMGQRMILMSVMMMIGTLILFYNNYESNLAKAWTISLTILAVFQWFNAWNCRSEKSSIFIKPLENIYMIYATLAAATFQLLAVYHPFFQKFLRTVPLDLSDWLIIIAFATSIIFAEEVRKLLTWQSRKSSLSPAPQLLTNQL